MAQSRHAASATVGNLVELEVGVFPYTGIQSQRLDLKQDAEVRSGGCWVGCSGAFLGLC